MNILAIDTSSKYFSLVVARDARIVYSRCEPFAKELSRKIIPAIDKALKKSGVSLKRIDYFGVGLGPGSFTGLRIGIASLKGILFPFTKPLAGVGSLDVLAQAVTDKEGLACPVVDAKRGLVYSAFYRLKDRQIKRASGYLLARLSELLAKIPPHTQITFLGDGLLLYQNDIEKALGARSNFITLQQLWYPQPENLLTCVREKIDKKIGFADDLKRPMLANFLVHRGSRPSGGRFAPCHPLGGVPAPLPNLPQRHRKVFYTFLCRKKEFSDADKIVPMYLYPKECQIKTV